jgi:small-conductance mechanosensitive channel
MAKGFVQHVPTLIIAIIVLMATWVAAKFAVSIAERLTRNTPIRENLKQLVETLVRLAIWVIGLMSAATISMPGLTPASLVAGLGVGALAIGFAFPVEVFAQEFKAGEVDFLVRWWSASRKRDLPLRDEIVRKVKRALDEAKIALPGTVPPPAAPGAA